VAGSYHPRWVRLSTSNFASSLFTPLTMPAWRARPPFPYSCFVFALIHLLPRLQAFCSVVSPSGKTLVLPGTWLFRTRLLTLYTISHLGRPVSPKFFLRSPLLDFGNHFFYSTHLPKVNTIPALTLCTSLRNSVCSYFTPQSRDRIVFTFSPGCCRAGRLF